MNTRVLKYASIFTAPAIGLFSLSYSGWAAWALPVYAFVIIPLADYLVPSSQKNMSVAEEEMAKNDPTYDWLLYAIVPLQYAILAYFLYIMSQPGLSVLDIMGKVFTMGIACSIFGINVAHELGHRAKNSEKTMSKMLLLTSMYMHFFIEHNRGHHKNVSTDDDPASSRLNEPLYTFLFRSVIFSYISAWNLEHSRLQKKGLPLLSFNNEMIRFTLIQIAFISLIFVFCGPMVTLYFLIAATIGFLLLEIINYIEHYGLRRKKLENGRWSKVTQHHSWNSNHAIGRIMLFELTRHSDHHYKASRKYQILRHFEDSPQLPYGYPAMMILSLVPPVFFNVMNKQIDQYQLSLLKEETPQNTLK